MSYLKPQSPLKEKTTGDYFYPLTTEDQIIMDNGGRLSGVNYLTIDEYGIDNNDPVTVNADTLGGYSAEEYVRHIQATPKAGFIYPLATNVIPDGFLLCDGAEYNRSEYPELFIAIGTTYGEGDGVTTFNVPNLQTRVPIGASENYELGSTGGEEAHTLTIDEMPNHMHLIGGGDFFDNTGGYGYNGQLKKEDNAAQKTNWGGTDYVGGSQSHNNMQPYTVVNYIIATGSNSTVSVQDIINGIEVLPLGVEHGGTGATNIENARNNLGITPENIGAMSMELLWENGSPSSSFGAQSIPISLENYNMVHIIPSYSVGTNGRLCPGLYIPMNMDESIGTINVSSNFNISRNVRVFRKENKIDFGHAYTLTTYGANGIEDNSSAIPILIYGVKF